MTSVPLSVPQFGEQIPGAQERLSSRPGCPPQEQARVPSSPPSGPRSPPGFSRAWLKLFLSSLVPDPHPPEPLFQGPRTLPLSPDSQLSSTIPEPGT